MKKSLAVNRPLVFAGLAVAALACFGQELKPLSGEELKAALAANPVWIGSTSPEYGNHKAIQFEFGSNGYVFGTVGRSRDSGPWEVRGDKLCFTLRKWTFVGMCDTVTRNADGSFNLGHIFKGRKE